ncbi:MAG TPA: pantoate--beta-alanine ligase [Virgibacillus sp.]|nr:pantoate--beta-alanine ligase [Virgibacillus sp.]
MKVIRSVELMQAEMMKVRQKEVGFVPTMGFFHNGHTSLMDEAKKENDIVVTSIFVNPLQFGPNEDFDEYPRDEEHDIKKAEEHGVDILFVPDVKSMYPQKMSVIMKSESRVNILCGRSRPGHFDGVITVLTKLFNIIQPTKVYFGMKDAQQLAVVDVLVKDYNFPIQVIGLPTVREDDKLAKSSRNVYLSPAEKKKSVWLYNALMIGQQLVVDGEKNPVTIIDEVRTVLSEKTGAMIDYVELLNYPNLQPVTEIKEQIILAVAVQFNQARLIDNFILDHEGNIVTRL